MSPYLMVEEFHKKYNVDINVEPTVRNTHFRFDLMKEELEEVGKELFPFSDTDSDFLSLTVDKIKLSKELADLMYVVIGTAVTFGLPLEQVFAEVHRSNMSKLGADGKPIYREDGKVLKGENYTEPDLKRYF